MKNEYTFTITLDDGTPLTQTCSYGSLRTQTAVIAKDVGLGRTQFNHYLNRAKGELNIGSINYKLWRQGTDATGRTRWATDVSSLGNPALLSAVREQLAAIGREQRASARENCTRDGRQRWASLPDEIAGTLTAGKKS